MSDVRLSNGSPPLERVDARTEEHTKPSVRRNLFGTPDPGEIRQAYLDELRESQIACKEKYNFDFVEDTPLKPGRYEWEAVDAINAPEVYSRPPHETNRTKRVDSLKKSQMDCQKPHSPAKKRPSLDDADSARHSKRMNHEDEDSSTQDKVEQTPRKSDPST